jgi:hypothetical protein
MAIESPSSFNEFSAEHSEVSGQELLNLYFNGLAAYRAQLAESKGISLGYLHNPRDYEDTAVEEIAAA